MVSDSRIPDPRHVPKSGSRTVKDSNLTCIKTLKENFNCAIGQSDHTNDIFVPLCAVAMGAEIIERHFMIDKSMKCVDRPVSITEIQMRDLVKNIRRFENSLGKDFFGVRSAERAVKAYRRFS